MTTIRLAATGVDGGTRSHGHARRRHVSFWTFQARRRKAIWQMRRGVDSFQPSTSVWARASLLSCSESGS